MVYKRFYETLLEVISTLGGDGFMADGLVVWGRIIGWIHDKRYLNAVASSRPDLRDSSIAWRTHTACWASRLACNVQGDFLEIGCYEGYSVCFERFSGEDFTVYGGRKCSGSTVSRWGFAKYEPLDQLNSLRYVKKGRSRFSDIV